MEWKNYFFAPSKKGGDAFFGTSDWPRQSNPPDGGEDWPLRLSVSLPAGRQGR